MPLCTVENCTNQAKRDGLWGVAMWRVVGINLGVGVSVGNMVQSRLGCLTFMGAGSLFCDSIFIVLNT
jgi:hypothetical protein